MFNNIKKQKDRREVLSIPHFQLSQHHACLMGVQMEGSGRLKKKKIVKIIN